MDFPLYPVFLSLKDTVCMVVGGGGVGERKVRSLLTHGATVWMIARELTPWLEDACAGGTVRLVGNRYDPSVLEKVDLVFAATSDMELNRRIGADARRLRLWCNMASSPREGTFQVPSVVERGSLSIAVSTGGASPALARRIKEQLEVQFGPEWAQLLRFMEAFRETVQSKGLESELNQRIFKEVSLLPLLSWISEKQTEAAVGEIARICHPWLDAGDIEPAWKEAWKPFSW